jgi:hypothetical protein
MRKKYTIYTNNGNKVHLLGKWVVRKKELATSVKRQTTRYVRY